MREGSFWKIGRQWLAALLSVLILGLGQAFNRQWRKAITFLGSAIGMYLIAGWTNLLHSAPGFAAWLFVAIVWFVYCVVDAYIYAGRPRDPLAPSAHWGVRFLFILIVCFHIYASAADLYLDSILSVRAFKIPSPSMAPTLVEGDRLIADMGAFRARPPERGELVVYDFQDGTRFIKRVVGVGGDMISSVEGKLYLNGEPLQEPYLQGFRQALGGSEKEWREPDFDLVTVPEGHYFVVGDNRPNSYDSRYSPHGLVSRSKLRGKPLYIYWSADRSRIGTTLK